MWESRVIPADCDALQQLCKLAETRLRRRGETAGVLLEHGDDLPQLAERRGGRDRDHRRGLGDFLRRGAGVKLQRPDVHAEQRQPVSREFAAQPGRCAAARPPAAAPRCAAGRLPAGRPAPAARRPVRAGRAGTALSRRPSPIVALPLQHNQALWVREHRFLTATENISYDWYPTDVWYETGQDSDDREMHYPMGRFGTRSARTRARACCWCTRRATRSSGTCSPGRACSPSRARCCTGTCRSG